MLVTFIRSSAVRSQMGLNHSHGCVLSRTDFPNIVRAKLSAKLGVARLQQTMSLTSFTESLVRTSSGLQKVYRLGSSGRTKAERSAQATKAKVAFVPKTGWRLDTSPHIVCEEGAVVTSSFATRGVPVVANLELVTEDGRQETTKRNDNSPSLVSGSSALGTA